MRDSPSVLIDKAIYGIIATVGLFLVNFLIGLNHRVEELNLQIAKNMSVISYHEGQLKALASSNETIFRVETEIGMHEKRLLTLERQENGKDFRNR